MTTTATPSHVVFGATGGIGAALCRRLAAGGANLILGARDQGKLERLAAELSAHAIQVDATRSDQVEACLAEALTRYGRLDGVAHCVGSLLLKPARLTTDEEWSATLAANLTSAFAVVRASARANAGRWLGRPRILRRSPRRTRQPRGDRGRQGRRDRFDPRRRRDLRRPRPAFQLRGPRPCPNAPQRALTATEGSSRASAAMHPLGRIGEPDDVAAGIAWLLDPRNSWVTGQVVGIDGGLADLRGRPGV